MNCRSTAQNVLFLVLGLILLSLAFGASRTSGSGHVKAPKLKKGGTLTVALAEDPDRLDPTLARTFVGRIVFANMCEKLYDINGKLQIVAQLASGPPKFSSNGRTVTIRLRSGVRFNDGTPFNAQAVKISLDRHRTLTGSVRASELSQVTAVTVVNARTVRLTLSEPFAPLIAQLADRAGMIMSPTQLQKVGDAFGTQPVCVGPFSFVSRTAGDRIELRKSGFYYDRARVNLTNVVFRIMTEGTVRAQNLRSRDVQAAERLPSTELRGIRADRGLLLRKALSLGYQGITINIANKNGLGRPFVQLDTPLARHPALRQALELSLDRRTINRVGLGGTAVPGCSPLSPVLADWQPRGVTCPARNLARARSLIASTGVPRPVRVELMIGTSDEAARIGQVIQALAREAGFDIVLRPTEFVTALRRQDNGQYDAFAIGWSGRVDPDGNIYQFHHTKGSQNVSGVSDPRIDSLLDQARQTTSFAKRKQLYTRATAAIRQRRSIIYLYHPQNFTGQVRTVRNIVLFGDGLVRLKTAGFVAGG
jgi:peptide/nickel transport system substrate-binding protein